MIDRALAVYERAIKIFKSYSDLLYAMRQNCYVCKMLSNSVFSNLEEEKFHEMTNENFINHVIQVHFDG